MAPTPETWVLHYTYTSLKLTVPLNITVRDLDTLAECRDKAYRMIVALDHRGFIMSDAFAVGPGDKVVPIDLDQLVSAERSKQVKAQKYRQFEVLLGKWLSPVLFLMAVDGFGAFFLGIPMRFVLNIAMIIIGIVYFAYTFGQKRYWLAILFIFCAAFSFGENIGLFLKLLGS